MQMRLNESSFAALDDKRECLSLEQRYKPIEFRHFPRNQRKIYYRFDVLQLNYKSCCCRWALAALCLSSDKRTQAQNLSNSAIVFSLCVIELLIYSSTSEYTDTTVYG